MYSFFHGCFVQVRITASWALANICDSLRHGATELNLEASSSGICNGLWHGFTGNMFMLPIDLYQFCCMLTIIGLNAIRNAVFLLADSALRLTKDGDKVRD